MFYPCKFWFVGDRRDDRNRKRDGSWCILHGDWQMVVAIWLLCIYLFFQLGLAVPTTAIAGVDVVGRVECWKIAVVFFVLTVKSSVTNNGDSWRLCSCRVKCRKIAVSFLFWRSGLAVRTTAIAGVYVVVGSSVERIISGVVLVY